MVLIFNRTVSCEISGTNFTRGKLSGEWHSASLRAILLPLNLTLVKFIPEIHSYPCYYIYIYICMEVRVP